MTTCQPMSDICSLTLLRFHDETSGSRRCSSRSVCGMHVTIPPLQLPYIIARLAWPVNWPSQDATGRYK